MWNTEKLWALVTDWYELFEKGLVPGPEPDVIMDEEFPDIITTVVFMDDSIENDSIEEEIENATEHRKDLRETERIWNE